MRLPPPSAKDGDGENDGLDKEVRHAHDGGEKYSVLPHWQLQRFSRRQIFKEKKNLDM